MRVAAVVSELPRGTTRDHKLDSLVQRGTPPSSLGLQESTAVSAAAAARRLVAWGSVGTALSRGSCGAVCQIWNVSACTLGLGEYTEKARILVVSARSEIIRGSMTAIDPQPTYESHVSYILQVEDVVEGAGSVQAVP
jgi:hypothetical protein